MSIMSSRASL